MQSENASIRSMLPGLSIRGSSSLRWLRLGAPAVADHAVSALAWLLVHVLLARALSPQEYGAFVVAHVMFLVGMAVHSAFVADPVLVFARGEYSDRKSVYCTTVVGLHSGIGGLLCIVLAATGAILGELGSGELARTFVAFAVASPFLLTLNVMRRISYARLTPGRALLGSGVHGALLVAGLAALLWLGRLDAVDAIYCTAASHLAGALWIAVGSREGWMLPDRSFVSRVVRLHADYGRWALPSALVVWIPWHLHFALLASWWSLEEVAALRALYNVTLPISHLLMSLSAVLLPVLASRGATGPEGAGTATLRVAAVFTTASLAYLGLVLAFGEPALAWIYGGAYSDVYFLAPWIAAVPVAVGGIMAMSVVHRAAGRTDHAFLTWLPYGALSVVLGAGGALLHGAPGLVGGILLAAVCGVASGGARFRLFLHRQRSREAA
jgi:O-antigen/teichoic acid export membrane protein